MYRDLISFFANKISQLVDCPFHRKSFLQPPKQSVQNRLAVFFIDRFGQRDVHGTGLDAVLRVATGTDIEITLTAEERSALQRARPAVQELVDVLGI